MSDRAVVRKKPTTPIRNAYDAFWFLTDHPKFKCREARLISEKEAKSTELTNGARISKVADEFPWNKKRYVILEYRLWREALSVNLDIYYTKVDESGRVNEDHSKNTVTECWLEFGPIKQVVSDGHLHVQHSHDTALDCGAPTFDEALVRLARLVKKHYGDYKCQRG